MSAIKQIQQTFQKELKGEKGFGQLHRQRLIEFRREKATVVRIEKPTNIARARRLGYKAKKGIIVARVRARKGSGKHKHPTKGRRPKRMGTRKLTRNISIKAMAEQKASRKYVNCEVLNSYEVAKDGRSHYFEVILVDTAAPEIKSDRELNWLCSGKHKGKAYRGLTSAGKKYRGLRKKSQ